jgi:starch synthase (maltosyl-transferring)
VRQRYLFAALFSTGILMPIGFEFGFRRRLHVLNTRPGDWEAPSWDDSEFIRRVNEIKSTDAIWNEDSPFKRLDCGNPLLAALEKNSRNGARRALLLINKNREREQACRPSFVEERLGGNYVEVSLPGGEQSVDRGQIALRGAGLRVFLAAN